MIGFPLDNTEYQAKDMGAYMATRTRGVLSADDNLAVTAVEGTMRVRVSPGIAWLQWSKFWGVVGCLDGPIEIELDIADGALPRIDTITYRLNRLENTVEAIAKKGAYSTAPITEDPVRDSNYDEIYLAAVDVGAGVTALTQEDITDLRLDETVCGIMRDGVTGIPTEQLQAQAASTITNVQEQSAALLDTTRAEVEAQVADTQAYSAELLNQLRDTIDATSADAAPNGIYLYTHSYDAEAHVHNFDCAEGLLTNGRALITAPYTAGDTWAVNGVAMPAYTGEDETDALPVGRWVTFTVAAVAADEGNGSVTEGWQLNFKGGGSGLACKVTAVAAWDALPAAAALGTLCLLTDVPVAYTSYSTQRPSLVQEGMVWVKLSSDAPASSGADLPLTKKQAPDDGIIARCAGVYQYTGGAWVPRAAKRWDGAAWADVTYSVTYGQGRAGTFDPQVTTGLTFGAAVPAFEGEPTSLPGFVAKGWSPALPETVTESIEVVPAYTQELYNVRYLPGTYGTFDAQTHTGLVYGDATPLYEGDTPASSDDAYGFGGWSPEVEPTVSASVDHVAQWPQQRWYVYRDGTSDIHINPGWTGNPGGMIGFLSYYMYAYSGGGANSRVYLRTSGTIDLTDYKTLYIQCQDAPFNAGHASIDVSTSGDMPTGADPAYNVRLRLDSANVWKWYSLDIASLTGSYYIKPWTVGHQINIYKVYLTK